MFRHRAAAWGRRCAAAAPPAAALAAASAYGAQPRAARCEDPVALGAALAGGAALGGVGGYLLGKRRGDAVEEKYGTFWPRKIMMMFGAPGAGKGTQGPKIAEMLGIPQLSTGDMLREAVAKETVVGRRAKEVMAAGGLVSDDIVIGIIRERIQEEDCRSGFILDGFPRSLPQAQALDEMLAAAGEAVSLVVAFDVDPAVLEERVCGRWVDKASGRSYHARYAPPKSMKFDADGKPIPSTMKDDVTGAPLMQRPDDTSQALRKRLDGYRSVTAPILDHYAPRGIVRRVNGGAPIALVWEEVRAKLGKKR